MSKLVSKHTGKNTLPNHGALGHYCLIVCFTTCSTTISDGDADHRVAGVFQRWFSSRVRWHRVVSVGCIISTAWHVCILQCVVFVRFSISIFRTSYRNL